MQRGGGITLPGTVGTKVGEGDVMITGANGYGRLEMTDGGEMVLRPNTRLKVESYRFHPDKPTDDNFAFNLLKGGLRTVTGLIGKRGNKDAYEGKTATATMGIRGTQYDMRFCQGDCGALADGTYIAVRFGAVHTGNAQGSVDVAAGQVALVQQAKPPVMLPRDPGIGFTPPPVIPKLDEKKKVQAAATAEAAKPAEGKPAASSPDKASQSSTKDKQQGDSKSGGKSESSESSDTKSKSGGSSSESGTETKENGGSDSGGKSNSEPGGKSGSSSGSSGNTSSSETTGTSNDASTGTSSGTGGGNSGSSTTQSSSAAPALQAAPGMDCSVQ